MDLVIEDELLCQAVRPLGCDSGFSRFRWHDLEDRPENVVERDEGGRHAAAGTQEVSAAEPQLRRSRAGYFLQSCLELPLPFGLRQRVELAVRAHAGQHW